MEQIPELKAKIPVNNTLSIAAIMALAVVAFYAGKVSERAAMQDTHHTKEIQNVKQMINDYHQFALDEVGGVRSDMDKEDRHLHDRINKLEK
jgi:uncharacterized membrane protein